MPRQLLRRCLWALGGLALGKLLLSLGIQLFPSPTPPALRFVLHSRWRRHYRDPARTLAPLAIAPGMRVLELGPGSGLFTAEAARLVGPEGLLVGADVQLGMLRPLRRAVVSAGLRNVALLAADVGGLPLADQSLDMAFAVAVLPMVRDKRRALAELARTLRPGGLLAVSEELIEPEYVPAWLIKRWCRRAGFRLVADIRAPLCYMLLFRKPESG